MKVFLVCWTSEAMANSSYYVDTVFKEKANAKAFVAKAEKDMYPIGKNFPGIYGEPWIEERETED